MASRPDRRNPRTGCCVQMTRKLQNPQRKTPMNNEHLAGASTQTRCPSCEHHPILLDGRCLDCSYAQMAAAPPATAGSPDLRGNTQDGGSPPRSAGFQNLSQSRAKRARNVANPTHNAKSTISLNVSTKRNSEISRPDRLQPRGNLRATAPRCAGSCRTFWRKFAKASSPPSGGKKIA